MPTKDELEKANASLARKVARLEARPDAPAKVVTKEVVREVIKEVPQPLEAPSPVDRGQLYVESHPTLGVISKATKTAESHGDGRIGDGATIVREHA